MSIISLLLNLLWIVFGGLWMALGWVVAAVVMAITIVGLPWARAAFNIAAYTLLPFGYKAVPRDEYLGREDVGTGPLGSRSRHIFLRARARDSMPPSTLTFRDTIPAVAAAMPRLLGEFARA
jgi:Inner membrane component domain